VALDGCRQASPERFQEMGFFVGSLNLSDLYSSQLRAFRGDSVEIVNDGANGAPAVVRARGRDDYFWTAELELIRRAYEDGRPRPLGEPLGLAITVDYTLPPDSTVLRIEVTFRNLGAQAREFLSPVYLRFGNSTPTRFFARNPISISGFTLESGVPWLAASNGDGAWAFAMKDANLAVLNVVGVAGVFDLNQALLSPLVVAPAGEMGDSTKVTYYFGVGGTDGNSAVRPLRNVNPEPLPGMRYSLVPLEGRTSDAQTGAAIPGVLVELQAQDSQGRWLPLDSFHSGRDGRYSGQVPSFEGSPLGYRLAASVEGRASPDPVPYSAGQSPVDFAFASPAVLTYEVKDQHGRGLPAKIVLWKGSSVARRIHTPNGRGSANVAAGTYEVSVTRGFEYTTHFGTLALSAGQTASLAVTLEHALDTSGFLSMDGHVHSGRSPDNVISIPDRIATVAAEGLEVVVSTDHEFIGSWSSGVEAMGLQDWVATVVGQEVTAVLPEHTNIYPVVPRFEVNARGDPVRWYGLDLAELFAAERERGAALVQLNHPRGYLAAIRYDPLTGLADLPDPTLLTFPADATLWSWGFDAVEYQNGPARVFGAPNEHGEMGMFEAWMSFQNLGHRVTAVGTSDAHDYEIVGTPRSYFASSTDSPAQFVEADLVRAVREGRVVVSTGAFARVGVNGTAGMGDLVTDTDGSVDLGVRIEAIPEIDVTHFKVFVNCDEAATVRTTAPGAVVKYDGTVRVPVPRDAHLVVLGFGRQQMPRGLAQFDPLVTPRFTTNPIFVDADGNGRFDPPGGKTCTYDPRPPGG
jgi:hypothetical protein